MKILDRYIGTLIGLAIGDALGTTLEFKERGTFKPLKDMVGGGPFNLPAGYWTDDTSMALCLGQSLIEKEGLDTFDNMSKYYDWYTKGYMSSLDRCFDIGITTRNSLLNFHETGQPIASITKRNSAGNGSIMRLCPIPMAYRLQPKIALRKAIISSKTTHGAPQATDACQLLTFMILLAFDGATKDEILADHLGNEIWGNSTLDYSLTDILKGTYKVKRSDEIQSSGYVIHTLESALWAFYNSDSFKEGALLIANLGDDSDTTAAVYGQLAGAYYGISAIPNSWLDKLHMREKIILMAEQLFELSKKELK